MPDSVNEDATTTSATNIQFDGPWAQDEEARIEQALEDAEERMSSTQLGELRGQWLARVSERSDGRYFVLHRRGMGAALTGARVNDLVGQIRSRWSSGCAEA